VGVAKTADSAVAGAPPRLVSGICSVVRASSTRPGRDDDLVVALRRELDAAERRVGQLRAQREQLEHKLAAATAAEKAGREALAGLRLVAGHATSIPPRADLPPTGRDENERAPRALAGGELRDTITRVALRRNAHGEPVHWRTWFGWFRDEGYDAAGKRAEATFQTQLARSPLVRRTERDGVYVLDVELLQRRREELLELHERLAQLPPPGQLALIGDARAERRGLQQEIGRAEKALEEAWRTLTDELGTERGGGDPLDPDQVMRIWRYRRRGELQESELSD
jgi:hypothetical protein